jgi:hypothetical protein
MAERKKIEARWSRVEFILRTALVAEKGNIACIDSADGLAVPASVATTLTPIGYFEESMTGDGTKKVKIKLFREIDVQLLPNATSGTVVAAANRLANVYLNADSSVTVTTTGRSIAGKAWDVVASGPNTGVWVQPV